MTLNVYLSGEIHTDWREQIVTGAADLDVAFNSPVTDHGASDDCGVAILGAEENKYWHDHKGAMVNAIRTRKGIEDADVVVVRFGDRSVEYGFNELDQLVPAYAITVHRAQGSEYPAVVIPLTTDHYLMLRRNLLYTAVTRGRKLVVLIGSRRALEMAVERNDQNQRRSGLAARLCQLHGNS